MISQYPIGGIEVTPSWSLFSLGTTHTACLTPGTCKVGQWSHVWAVPGDERLPQFLAIMLVPWMIPSGVVRPADDVGTAPELEADDEKGPPRSLDELKRAVDPIGLLAGRRSGSDRGRGLIGLTGDRGLRGGTGSGR